MQPKTILVIDDNQFILKLVSDILDRCGYIVFAAQTGLGGYEIACNEQPDLIILDRRLDDVTGDSVLKNIKKNEKTRTIPVTILSAENHYNEIIKSIALGAEDYIVKPFKQGTLLRKVERLLRKSRGTHTEYVYL